MSLVCYKEYPRERERVEAMLRRVGPGEAARLDMDLWSRAFTRLTGPLDILLGPSETALAVCTREWPDLEFRQVSHFEVELVHWHIPSVRTERRIVLELEAARTSWGEVNEASTDCHQTEIVEVQVILDRRTGSLVENSTVEGLRE